MIGIYVDGQNLYRSVTANDPKKRPNYEAIMASIVKVIKSKHANSADISRQVIYTASTRPMTVFNKLLSNLGFSVHSHRMRGTSDKFDWDVGIAVHILSDVSERIVTAIYLVSGDGDFEPLVSKLADDGIDINIVGFVGSTSNRYDNTINLTYKEHTYDV